ncbi:methylmalonyl Co-A mutase-associated GTPase MeaB [Tunturibacter empetritectus]|uniref:LAO/AO transport system kinase n=1 Tax=Tunturiibacter empetritectus TaxID=3069691 RepID=A0A7W8II96_9BACT|nr:methylmalonyl Co-A mutase-associated GTPase MeaB [Edaphobacter lichenicola]MBB5316688.1 LAO/AO transport system kinase [Edaphobacter lichenicola]
MAKDFRTAGVEVTQMMVRMREGDLRALARTVSLVEDGGGAELLEACREFSGGSLRVGVTGPPGAGKSTLVDQMVRWLRREGQSVGVVAVDPSSPYTGGALLGDRIRMQGFAGDDGVFIRSMASRGAMGGVARAAADVCSVMEAAGRKTIVIETVGVGQDEVDVIGLANVTVLVLVPGMGDGVQSLKAGVMEVADVFVVNKSDRGGAELVEQEIVAMQGLAMERGEWVPPVVRTVATTGEGVGELMETVRRCAVEKGARRVRIEDAAGKNVMAQSGLGGLRLDHLGVAVKSIAGARGFYEALGLVVSHEETVEHERVKTAMLPLGESRIELLEATEADSTIGRFLAKRGEGLHHIAVHVDGIDAMFARLMKQGVRLASDAVRVGAGGHRYFFVHPASTGGVLLEIVGDAVEPREGGA